MKKVIKPNISNILTIYAEVYPNNSWDNFRNSGWEEPNLHPIRVLFKASANGVSPYKDIQEQLFQYQGGICAYCEQDFPESPNFDDYIEKIVEHFHPKRDDEEKNWGLDWNNLLGCCNGGDKANKKEYPRPKNLSCDRAKEHFLKKENVEGNIINPINMPAFPCLFSINQSEGKLVANETNCSQFNFPINNFPTTKELVDNTIHILNLNCNRLIRKRMVHIRNFHEQLKKAREHNDENIFQELCERFLNKKNGKYHCFFTTYRILLSSNAETYLQKENFCG